MDLDERVKQLIEDNRRNRRASTQRMNRLVELLQTDDFHAGIQELLNDEQSNGESPGLPGQEGPSGDVGGNDSQ